MVGTRPRVVYWDNIPAPYAVERYNTLAARGTFDFSVWFSRRTDPERSWDVDESAWQFNGAYVEDPAESLASADEFARRCEALRPDLILALYGERTFAAGHLILKGLGLRTALLVLPTYDAWVRRSWWKEAAKRYLFRSADAAKVPGADGLAYALRYGFTPYRVFAVRQSITVDRYAAPIAVQHRERIRIQMGLSGCVFLYVGRLWNGKGLPVLIDAFKQVVKVNPAVSLLLVGDGPDEGALRSAAAAIPGVHFQSFVQAPELPQYYGSSDVFVFPTLGDPHGQVIEEAHAAGLPIIASDAAGDIRHRVADGVNGFVVPAGDAAVLADRMIALAADASMRRIMGARGAERATAWNNDKWADDFEWFVTGALALPRRSTTAARTAAVAGTLALTAADIAARTRVWRKKAEAGVLKTMGATMVARANRLGMWLMSLGWRLNRPSEGVRRFGTRVGGWMLPVERLAEGGVCYCAGVGEDTSLEEDLLRETECLVWSFDPTPESAAHVAASPLDPARFQFVQTGIGDRIGHLRFFQHPDPQMLPAYSAVNIWNTSSYFDAPTTTVPALMDRFGHERLTLLKLSIDGAEFRVLTHLFAGGMPDVSILCVVYTQPVTFWRVASSVRDLGRRGFRYLCHNQWKFTFVRMPRP